MYSCPVHTTSDDPLMRPSADAASQQSRALRAIQSLTDAMDHMHSSMTQSMQLNASDLRALRAMSIMQLRGHQVTPFGLAEHLSMSTAATTALIRRLVDHGFLRRQPHSRDRRSQVLTLTDEARRTFHQHFSEHLSTIRAVIAEFSPHQLEAAVAFMERLAEQLTESDPQ